MKDLSENKVRGLRKGEKMWTLRQFDDAKPRLYYPHELLDKFIEYKEWIEENPLYEGILHQKSGNILDVPKMRAMTIKGFCLYAGIAQNTFYGYAKKEEYKVIIQVIEDAVYVQKFEGASAGLLNTNIIVRDLGLSDTVKHSISDERKTIDELFPPIEDIEAIDVEETSQEEIKKLNEDGEPEEDK
jgi:nitrogen regulatory protein PII-like uncharacterized protein